jgi:aminoglycoside 2''-phosphotransferase
MVFPLESEMHYLPFIERILPDLHVQKIILNSDGLANDVVVVNDEFVFRFAKGEFGRVSLARELQVLDVLPGRTGMAVPEPIYTSEYIIAYRFLTGEPFTRRWLAVLEPERYKAAANSLGAFLKNLHSVRDPGLPLTAAPVGAESFRDQRKHAREQLYPLLLPHQVDWVEQLFAFIDQPGVFEVEPVLVHGDLAPYHILFDQHSLQLSGVIDFGVSGLGDPASDFGALLQYYGLEFVSQMAEVYPGIERLLPRARFYAQSIEIQWVLLGLKRGENFWFTAHLGGWRGFVP